MNTIEGNEGEPIMRTTDQTEADDRAADAANRLRWEIGNAITAYVRESGGTIEDAPIFPGAASTTTRPAPLDGIRAARRAARVAENEAHYSVRAARSAGLGWDAIGDALGIEPDHDSGRSRAERAFDECAPRPSMRFDTVTFGYTCGTCAEIVTDMGPYESHPHDNER